MPNLAQSPVQNELYIYACMSPSNIHRFIPSRDQSLLCGFSDVLSRGYRRAVIGCKGEVMIQFHSHSVSFKQLISVLTATHSDWITEHVSLRRSFAPLHHRHFHMSGRMLFGVRRRSFSLRYDPLRHYCHGLAGVRCAVSRSCRKSSFKAIVNRSVAKTFIFESLNRSHVTYSLYAGQFTYMRCTGNRKSYQTQACTHTGGR